MPGFLPTSGEGWQGYAPDNRDMTSRSHFRQVLHPFDYGCEPVEEQWKKHGLNWDSLEVSKLEQGVDLDIPTREIARQLGRTQSAIHSKKRREHLTRNYRNPNQGDFDDLWGN